MMVYLRLLAGFTSLRLKRWRSHRVSIGPVGDFESSSMLAFLSYCQEAGHHRDRDGAVADGDQDGENGRALLQLRRVARMAEAHRLKHAPQAVIQVHAQQDHGQDVERRDGGILKSGDHVVAHVRLVGRRSPAGARTAPTVRCSTWKITNAATIGRSTSWCGRRRWRARRPS